MATDAATADPPGVLDPPEPSPWPLAEETLARVPAWREYYASREDLGTLEAAPSVVVESGIRAQFDRDLEVYSEQYDGSVRALVDGWYAEKWEIVFQHSRPLPADVTPVAGHALAAGDDWASEQARQDADASLARWTKGVTLADPEIAQPDPDAEVVEGVIGDDAVTARFLKAFAEDPEGDADRAQPPGEPEIHHDTQILYVPPAET